MSKSFEQGVYEEARRAARKLDRTYAVLLKRSDKFADLIQFKREWILSKVTLPRRADTRRDDDRVADWVYDMSLTLLEHFREWRRDIERARLIARLELTDEEVELLGIERRKK